MTGWSDEEDLEVVRRLVGHLVDGLHCGHLRHEDLFDGYAAGRYAFVLSVTGFTIIENPPPFVLGIGGPE